VRRRLRPRGDYAAADVLYRGVLGREPSEVESRWVAERLAAGADVMSLVEEFSRSEEGLGRALRHVRDGFGEALERKWSERGPRPRMVFVHIMKVGGTSLCEMMRDWLGPRAEIHMSLDDLVLQPRSWSLNFELIAGHFPYEGVKLVPGRFSTMCVMRDPMERALSHLNDIRRHVPGHSDLSLDEYLSSEVFAVPRGNYQARVLAHEIGVDDAWVTYSPRERYLERSGSPNEPMMIQALFYSTPILLDDAELLDTANKRLESMEVVGITEDLEPVGQAVASFYGVPPQPVPRLNVSPASEQLTAAQRRRLDQSTAVDRELYDLVRRRAE
jgi:hypothetical protein